VRKSRRHILIQSNAANGGFDSSVSGMMDFEQGFIDAVRQFYKYVREALEDRMLLYQNIMENRKKMSQRLHLHNQL